MYLIILSDKKQQTKSEINQMNSSCDLAYTKELSKSKKHNYNRIDTRRKLFLKHTLDKQQQCLTIYEKFPG